MSFVGLVILGLLLDLGCYVVGFDEICVGICFGMSFWCECV